MILMSFGSHWANVKYGIIEVTLEIDRVCFVGSFISIMVVLNGGLPASHLPWHLPQTLPWPPLWADSLPIMMMYDCVLVLLESYLRPPGDGVVFLFVLSIPLPVRSTLFCLTWLLK